MNQSVHKTLRMAYALIIAIIGSTIILIGIVLLLLPGPGIAVIIVGLGVLASEFAWARRLLKKTKNELKKEMEKLWK
jgi:uncharacterized protein (TIGR02611 family)